MSGMDHVKRWILHVDMNSYFASVEQQCRPELRGQPIAVGGKPGSRAVVAAASREAKALGVRTAMPSHKAIRMCPHLIFVEPDYKKYEAYSEQMFGILETFSPDLEIFSIDEAFLAVVQPQICSLIDAETNQRGSVNGSADVSSPELVDWIVDLVWQIKTRLRTELGPVLTASIGVARGKRLAKLASESQKPDGFTVLLGDEESALVAQFRTHHIRAFTRAELYARTDIETLAGIGPRLGRRLRAASIHTLADLARCPYDELAHLVFPYHKELFMIGQGKDPSPVVPYWAAKAEQSIGHQYTLPSDIPVGDLPPTLMWLAERVGHRMRSRGFVAHRVSLYLRRTNAPGWGTQCHTTSQIESDLDLYQAAWRMISTAADHPGEPLDWFTPIRMPSLTVSDLVSRRTATQSLEPSEQQRVQLATILDRIRSRYGRTSITSGLSHSVHYHDIPDGRRKRFTPTIMSNYSN